MKGRDEVTTPKKDTATFENPADQAVLADVNAQIAAGGDPFGDMDDDDGAPAPTPAPAPAAGAPAPASNDADSAESASDTTDTTAAAPVPAPAPEPAPPAPAPAPAPTPAPAPAEAAAPPPAQREQPAVQFKTRSIEDIDKARKELLIKKAKAFKDYSDGAMTPEEFSAIDDEVMVGISDLASERALAQATQQAALSIGERAIEDIKRRSKTAGLIDYDADPTAAQQFNAALQALAVDPTAAQLPEADFYERAHQTVLFLRGKTAEPAPAPAAPTPAQPRQDLKAPITLRDVPAAATPHTGGGMSEQLERMHGLDFEEAVGRIPKAQRDAWLDT